MATEWIGISSASHALRQEIDDVAGSAAKVLITGESGVGKDIVARLIHERSGRTGPFVTINCAGVPDSLLESELFGHVRGSFTGAHSDRRGWLDRTAEGTIFLDEVGEMSLRMQALLLRFVEHGEIQRVGAHRIQHVGDVRIIAATNRNLMAHVAAKRFREDLYYRLNVIHLVVPPLRERLDDIGVLAEHFLELFAASHHLARPTLREDALAELTVYSWPGNVRELRNVIERIVVRNRVAAVTAADVGSAGVATATAPRHQEAADVLYERMIKNGESFWSVVHGPFTFHDLTRADVRALVTRGLAETRGDYHSLLTLFNVPEHDYKRFLNFLTKHGCRLSVPELRMLRVRPAPPVSRAGSTPSRQLT